jgi:hypothetical protein
MRPIRSEFLSTRSPGERRNQRVFDSTPLLALDAFSGGIYGMMTNPANRWFALRLQDEDLNDFDPVRDWLYEVETRILDSFGPDVTRFYSTLPAFYCDVAAFGTAIHYSEEIPGSHRVNDNVRSLAECVIAESAFGEVDTVYRRFGLTGRQSLEQFGDALATRTKQRAERDPHCMIYFLHCVSANTEYAGESLDKAKRPYLSEYVEEESRHMVARGGYYELPYQVARWSTAAGEVYGRGIGEQVLPDVKMLNRMDETSIKAAQKMADPPLAAPDEGVIKAARTWPGGITYGAIDQQGNQLLKPLYTGGDTRLTLEMMDQRRNSIKEAFYFSLMQMIGSPNMTATEWMGRQEEKLRLLGPNLGRIQCEFLNPLIKRRFGLLLRAGQLPPPPQEIQGRAMSVEYVSPLARMQMAGEAQSVVRLYQSLGMIAQIDPGVMDNVDNDEAVKILGRGWAVPQPMLRGKDEVAQLRDHRAQQQQAQMALAAAEQGGKAAKSLAGASKDFAQAQATSGEQGGQAQQGTPDISQAVDMLRKAIRGRAA